MLREIPSRTKIFIMVTSIALLVLVNGIYSIYQIEQIKTEFQIVADNDLPMSTVITQITLTNLESSILLEKAHALSFNLTPGDEHQSLAQVREDLKQSGKAFRFTVNSSRNRLKRSILTVESYRGSRRHSRLLTLLNVLEKKHSQFEQEAARMIDAIDRDDRPETERRYALATAEKNELQKALTHMLSEIESLTTVSSVSVLRNESDMIRNKALATLLTFVIGLWMVMQINRIILERDRAQSKLEFLAIHDPLTGLYNRRHFISRLAEMLNGSLRYGYDVSLCLCDLDHFKKINDNYGHVVGDEVLRRFAQIISLQIRREDIAGRYGGDEFVILFPNTDAGSAQLVLERIREQFAQEVFNLPDGRTCSLSATFGVTDFDRQIPEPSLMIESADLALYEAKKLGRNRVVAQSNSFRLG